MIRPIKIFLIAIWNFWFYVLSFTGIIISLPFLFIFSLKVTTHIFIGLLEIFGRILYCMGWDFTQKLNLRNQLLKEKVTCLLLITRA